MLLRTSETAIEVEAHDRSDFPKMVVGKYGGRPMLVCEVTPWGLLQGSFAIHIGEAAFDPVPEDWRLRALTLLAAASMDWPLEVPAAPPSKAVEVALRRNAEGDFDLPAADLYAMELNALAGRSGAPRGTTGGAR